jgi:parvulin-like peptidyl-prolyl isomerase
METPFDALGPEALALLRRHNLLRKLVERVVVDEAVAGTPLDPEEKEQSRQQFLRSNGIRDPQALERYLRANGLTADELEHQIEQPLKIRRHAAEHFRPKAEARFLSRKNQLDRVVYSLLRVKDRLLARELYLRIAAGEATFPELAARHAEGPERSTNGIVGPVPLTQSHPLLAERLRTTTPGVLLEPFQVGEWWLVVRLENYTPAAFDDAVALQMAAELFSEWVQEETTRRVADLCGSAPAAAAATSA